MSDKFLMDLKPQEIHFLAFFASLPRNLNLEHLTEF